ncbi:hypothetical protein G6F16_005686 [Rhizopus arrhizus]|nr:hypothetical protein G6F23_011099 [Rhizopus arrhizus]KAG0754391.1 hypothetical protein G6F24_012468 [Rhizopus arrhizus]KAG0764426.1 hypothetical protein G6F22_018227 [Rhizopus arrhizus]KAG0780237.1 hypothetical protein G6F21_012226 [Rhizopus arrhizus]KAG0809833.1 hypothetical protein G6F20_008456 [Rhizopus arrhizus]
MPYVYTSKDKYIESIRSLSQLIKQYQNVINQDSVARCLIGFTTAQLIRDATFPIDLESIENWLKTRHCHQDILKNNNSSLDTLLDILENIHYDLMTEEHQNEKVKDSLSEDILNRTYKQFPICEL